jgi:hypothetical protein
MDIENNKKLRGQSISQNIWRDMTWITDTLHYHTSGNHLITNTNRENESK